MLALLRKTDHYMNLSVIALMREHYCSPVNYQSVHKRVNWQLQNSANNLKVAAGRCEIEKLT